MPIGNGDVAASVWVDATGSIHAYLAKGDAWSENAHLLKIGRVEVRLSPSPISGTTRFRQTLDPLTAELTIEFGEDEDAVSVLLFVDSGGSALHVDINSACARNVEVMTKLWRENPRKLDGSDRDAVYIYGEGRTAVVDADTLLAGFGQGLAWYHHNTRSIWASSLKYQGLGDWAEHATDPLLDRVFGAYLWGTGLAHLGPDRIGSSIASTQFRIHAAVLTQHPASPQSWQDAVLRLADEIERTDPECRRAKHREWWSQFWRRSHVSTSAHEMCGAITDGYALQRYLHACAGRGQYPIKFNGSLFTVEPRDAKGEATHDPDHRRWGGPYWHQNTRLPYWSMLASGDYDMMRPFFRMYADALPFSEYRCRRYFGHDGAFFPETMHFWGGYADCDYDYGTQREPGTPCHYVANPFIRYHFQGGIEVVACAIEYYEHNPDEEFVSAVLLPLARAVMDFYALHYPRDSFGRLRITPAQALETIQDALNPLPEVVGLAHVVDRLLNLPDRHLSPELRKQWEELTSQLPPLPIAQSTDGKVLMPAESYGEVINIENPELYSIFPYKLHGVGKPDLAMARRTFDRRCNKGVGGWSQDAIQAALLGDTELASKYVSQAFVGRDPRSRFPAYWAAHHDWVPDQDHGSTAMIALQAMLMQCEGQSIRILPSWPAGWDVSFRLHAPGPCVVECDYRAGRIERLSTEPAHRMRDLAICVDGASC